MARALAEILKEISASYKPQKNVINTQMGALDPQMSAEQKGLDAAKTDSFQQITDQSNRRGLLFSGIPIAEQAQYTGSSYLPAVANLKSKYAQQKFNLQNALAQLDQSAYKDAYGVYNDELNRDASLAASRASGGGGGVPGFGDVGGGGGGGGGESTDPVQQAAYNDVYSRVNSMSAAQIKSDYLATLRSANYGNVRDKFKIQLYNQFGYKFDLPTAKAAPSAPVKSPSAPTQVRQQLGGSSPSLYSQLIGAFR